MATAASISTDRTTCPICLELFDNPKALPCLHAFCLKCLQGQFHDKSSGNEASCPICRKDFRIPLDGIGGLQHHFYVQEMVDERNMRPDSCDKHSDKQVELYCHDCNENICIKCLTAVHRNHNYGEIREVADSFKQSINDDDERIVSAISGVEERSGQTKRSEEEFISEVEDVKKIVLATGDIVKRSFERSVDDQINDMLTKLQAVTSESADQAINVQEACLLAIVSMDSFHTYSRELLDKGRPSDVTRAARELHERAEELMNNDVTAVEYHPPHVTFTPADVTQMKCLTLIGKLAVTTNEQSGERVLTTQLVEIEQEKQSSDTASAVLQDELIQAAVRERQLQMQLDKLQKELDNIKLEQEMKQREMGREIQRLPQAETVSGVTSLDNHLYMLRGSKTSEQVEVYNIDSYRLQRYLTVPRLGTAYDIVACAHNRCAYISDSSHKSIHKIALSGDTLASGFRRWTRPRCPGVTHWPVNDKPLGLSLSLTHGVLVTCFEVRKIKEFSTDGQLLHEVALPDDVVSPFHSVQLSSGEFIVCHGNPGDPLHRVCLVSSDGHVVKSFGAPKGSSGQQMNVPIHLAVDKNEFVFVADSNNRRVLLLSPSLTFVRQVVSSEQLTWRPRRIHLDVTRQCFYVAHNEYKDSKFTAGQVVVFSV